MIRFSLIIILFVSSLDSIAQRGNNNGFVLSDLRIPSNEIHSGGPPKDGIPAILEPSFDSRSTLDDREQVLGLSVNGIQKAYPIKILNFHEVVNDWFGDQPVLITFCPLCGSGVGFVSRANGENLTFGVSGLLYNSDVLLYDHQTESLWSQLMQSAISGEYSGTKLKMLSLTRTTWGEWKKQHPASLALSDKTGYVVNYNSSPYTGYFMTDRLMFPVNKRNDILTNKEVVLGVQIGSQFKAYPLSRLKKKITADTFNGIKFNIRYDQKTHSAWVESSSIDNIKSTTLFWFAWYAFHPDTEIFVR